LDAFREREALDRTTLDKLRAVARQDLVGEDRTMYDLFEWRLNRRLEQFRLRVYLTPFWDDDRFVGFAGVLRIAAELSEASRGKVESFPAYVNQAIALLREGIRARMLPSGDLVRSVSGRCTDIPSSAKPGDTSLNEARRAAKEFCRFLSNEYIPACPASRSLSQWPNGTEVNRELARRYTTTDLDPKQIHEFGVSEVALIRAAMLPLIARTGHKGSLDDFLKYVRTEPRFYFSNGDDLLAAYRAALTRIEPLVPMIIGHIPNRPLKVEPYQGDVAASWHARSAVLSS
jgi:prolyl oligopeptidase